MVARNSQLRLEQTNTCKRGLQFQRFVGHEASHPRCAFTELMLGRVEKTLCGAKECFRDYANGKINERRREIVDLEIGQSRDYK